MPFRMVRFAFRPAARKAIRAFSAACHQARDLDVLVVTANWAIADGTLVSGSRRPQTEWLQAVHRAAIRAGFHRDGRYEPVERLQIVLAGDTFDWLTTAAWTARVRPWHRGPQAEAVRGRVMIASARRAGRLLAGLSRWSRYGMPVPRSDRRGRPLVGGTVQMPVLVTFLVGDRDRWLAAAAGRAARRGMSVATTWGNGQAFVWHGAEFDPCCCTEEPPEAAVGPGAERPTLAESLAVDLVARFGAAVRSSATLWPACRTLVAELAAARPFEMPAVLEAWLAAAEGDAVRERQAVVGPWRAAVAAWRRAARLVEPACGLEFDSLDALAGWLDAVGEDRGRRSLPPGETLRRAFDAPAADRLAGTLRDGAAAVVLGHPAADGVGGFAGPRLVCLGAAASLPAGGGVDPMNRPAVDVACVGPVVSGRGPAHVMVVADNRAIRWEWLSGACRRAVVAGRVPSADAQRIVEAA